MINEALLIAHRHAEAKTKEAQFIEDLKKLPLEELKSIVETGEIKLAFLDPSESPGRSASWLDTFKGTPFFEQAIALEQEELQMAMSNSQASSVTQQKQQQEWTAMDQIRLKKRLLELQKARNESQVLSGGGGPANMTGSGAGSEAQGAGALGPVASEGQQEGSGDAQKLGAVRYAAGYPHLRKAVLGATTGGAVFGTLGLAAGRKPKGADPESFAAKHPRLNAGLRMGAIGAGIGGGGSLLESAGLRPGAITHEVKHLGRSAATKGKALASHVKDSVKAKLLHGEGKKKADEGAEKMLGMMKKKSSVDADLLGRAMARQDMAKVARANELLAVGDASGRALTKVAGNWISNESIGHTLLNPLPGSGFGAGFAGAMTEPGQPDAAARGAGLGAMMGSAAMLPAAITAMQAGSPGGVAVLIPLLGAAGGAIGGAHAAHAAAKEKTKKAGALAAVGKWALEHPGQAGAVAGGTLGAAHGLMREGGGVGQALTEGAAGAGLGHAAGSIAGGTRSIQGSMADKLKGSAQMYGSHVKNEAMRLSDKLKSVVKPAQPPEASLGGPQTQKLD